MAFMFVMTNASPSGPVFRVDPAFVGDGCVKRMAAVQKVLREEAWPNAVTVCKYSLAPATSPRPKRRVEN